MSKVLKASSFEPGVRYRKGGKLYEVVDNLSIQPGDELWQFLIGLPIQVRYVDKRPGDGCLVSQVVLDHGQVARISDASVFVREIKEPAPVSDTSGEDR